MILNNVLSGGMSYQDIFPCVIARPIYRCVREFSDSDDAVIWSSDISLILQNTSYNIGDCAIKQTTKSRYHQTVSYYTFVVRSSSGSEVNLKDYIDDSNNTVGIRALGNRNNITGLFNSRFEVKSSARDNYTIVAGSTDVSAMRYFSFNSSDFNQTVTTVDGRVLSGLILYVSTGDSNEFSSGSGGQYISLSLPYVDINGETYPVIVETWHDISKVEVQPYYIRLKENVDGLDTGGSWVSSSYSDAAQHANISINTSPRGQISTTISGRYQVIQYYDMYARYDDGKLENLYKLANKNCEIEMTTTYQDVVGNGTWVGSYNLTVFNNKSAHDPNESHTDYQPYTATNICDTDIGVLVNNNYIDNTEKRNKKGCYIYISTNACGARNSQNVWENSSANVSFTTFVSLDSIIIDNVEYPIEVKTWS